MIRKLQVRMTLMVISVLVLVTAGIVAGIWWANIRSIQTQAEKTLSVLAENSGRRPFMRGLRSGTDEQGYGVSQRSENRTRSERFEQSVYRPEAVAGLANFYTIVLNEDGTVREWESDRAEQYSEEEVAETAKAVLAEDRDQGQIGSRFFLKTNRDDKQLVIVLDARLEYLAAGNMLRSTALIACGACLLLSLLAWLLVRRMVKPVEEAFTRQKQFVSDASHELKTPLAVISANAEVLESEIGENEYLGYIRSEVSRTDNLVKNLLLLARMDQGKISMEMKPFDLGRSLLDVILPFESTVYEAGKTLETEIPDGVEYAGNEAMIQQLAVILLSNALKYSDEHGKIRVCLRTAGKQREILVENTGKAIPEADQAHLFDRFWRGDSAHSRQTDGHGLGLAIARGIAEAHHGRISVHSREGENTVFTVTL